MSTHAIKAGRLAGKTAIITGGGAGIGAACASIFCDEGASVLLVDADEQALIDTSARLVEQARSSRVSYLVGDVAEESVAQQAMALVQEQFGHLNILVNNAAMRNNVAVAQATPDAWQRVLNVNLMGTAGFCRAAIPLLRQANQASIVNVSSCYGVVGRKGMAIYDASKAGMLALTRTLACEEAEFGIRANAVCPGPTLTSFQLKKAQLAGRPLEALMSDRADTSLLGRWAKPEEIAYPILWLASDEASFVTGTMIMVDGGVSAF